MSSLLNTQVEKRTYGVIVISLNPKTYRKSVLDTASFVFEQLLLENLSQMSIYRVALGIRTQANVCVHEKLSLNSPDLYENLSGSRIFGKILQYQIS
jgi:hypothetical protein